MDTIIRLKPVADMTSVTDHFRDEGQCLGLSGSNCGSKATRKGSSGLEIGWGWGGGTGPSSSVSRGMAVMISFCIVVSELFDAMLKSRMGKEIVVGMLLREECVICLSDLALFIRWS